MKVFISHNVHELLHIVNDCQKYGSLNDCSCFPFQNFLKCFKKIVWKFEKPLEQVVKRYKEILDFTKPKVSLNSNLEI